MIKFALLFLCAMYASGQQIVCQLSSVTWKDAAIYTKQNGLDPSKIDNLPVTSTSIGCVIQAEHTVLVISHFVEGRPDQFIAIPKEWVMTIQPLKGDKEKK